MMNSSGQNSLHLISIIGQAIKDNEQVIIEKSGSNKGDFLIRRENFIERAAGKAVSLFERAPGKLGELARWLFASSVIKQSSYELAKLTVEERLTTEIKAQLQGITHNSLSTNLDKAIKRISFNITDQTFPTNDFSAEPVLLSRKAEDIFLKRRELLSKPGEIIKFINEGYGPKGPSSISLDETSAMALATVFKNINEAHKESPAALDLNGKIYLDMQIQDTHNDGRAMSTAKVRELHEIALGASILERKTGYPKHKVLAIARLTRHAALEGLPPQTKYKIAESGYKYRIQLHRKFIADASATNATALTETELKGVQENADRVFNSNLEAHARNVRIRLGKRQ